MCFPPFCEPATRFLGCFSLRIGAAVVLVLNAVYGLSLIVVHALLLGEEREVATTTSGPFQEPSAGGSTTLAPSDVDSGWLLQLMDLDVSWGHDLLRFDDYSCLVCGLLYGIVIVMLCGYMFHATLSQTSYLAISARWFVAFMHLELVVFVGLMMAKLSKVCTIQQAFLPKLAMKCEVLKFMYLERCVVMLTFAGFCCWVFASMSYLLTVGNQSIDRAEFAAMLDMNGPDTHDGDFSRENYAPAVTSRGLPTGLQPGAERSFRVPMGPVGEPVRAGFTTNSMRSMSMSSSPPQRTSYHIPRATSSASSATRGSNYGDAPRSLVKPPVAIY